MEHYQPPKTPDPSAEGSDDDAEDEERAHGKTRERLELSRRVRGKGSV
jgi:hypothetical protein